jgi:predicted phage terminase large subunit-like protein
MELIPFAGAGEFMIGTLWNVYDPLYRMEILYGDNPLYRFRKIPALNENDETNFPYQYTTEYLHDMRERLDAPEWFAKWMQSPFVREGLLYLPNELLYFNGECPEGKTIAILDPAVGGGDYLSMVMIRIANGKNYIIDWLYTNETKGKTIPAICNKVIFHNVTELHYERNGIGRAFEEDVTKELHNRDYYRCKSMPFNAPEGMSKEDKILGYSDWVKSNLYFIEEEAKSSTYSRSTDYTRALNDMFIYTTVGKNKHDDAVDNLAQTARVFEKQRNGAIDIILNPFR